MRVLHIIPAFQPAINYGGPIVSVSCLCMALQGIGVEIKILTTNAAGVANTIPVDVKAETKWNGLRVRYCKRTLPEMVSVSYLREVAKYVGWCDVVHLTGIYNFTTFPAIWAARRAGKPVVWSPRGALQRWEGSRKRKLKSIWDRIAENFLDETSVMHVTSEQEATESAMRLRCANWRIVANGIEIPESIFRPDPGTDLRLGFLGRLDPKKGLENLILSVSRLETEYEFSGVTLLVAGQGEPGYQTELKHLVSRLGLGGKITFTGFLGRERKAQFFSEIDLAVFPSHTENFGLVVGEALGHEVPVIVSPNMPWSGVLKESCGWQCENSPEALAELLSTVNRDELPEMGRKGRAWVMREFSWREKAVEMAAVYREAVSRAGG